jgi:anti-sigma B factor antagonist
MARPDTSHERGMAGSAPNGAKRIDIPGEGNIPEVSAADQCRRPPPPAADKEDAMLIAEFSQNDVTVAEARGRIDSSSSREFGDRLGTLMVNGANKVLVDLTNIAYISSAGFRALLEIGRQSEACQCNLALCGLNQEVQRLFEISGFMDLFQIFSTRHEGIEVLSER